MTCCKLHDDDCKVVVGLLCCNRCAFLPTNYLLGVLRSAYAIAEREGQQTNWASFKRTVGRALETLQ